MEHKIYLFLCVILGFGSIKVSGKAKSFQCPSSIPCIKLDLDATLHLVKVNNPNDTQVFDLTSATVVDSECICHKKTNSSQEPIIMLQLFPSKESLRFVFPMFDKPSKVYMQSVFDLQPYKHFKDGRHVTIELTTGPDINMGNPDKSYVCKTSEIMKFNTGDYELSMNITHLHAQAYNVTNGAFSTADECMADMSTIKPAPSPTHSTNTSPRTTNGSTPMTTNSTPLFTSKTTPPLTTNGSTPMTTNSTPLFTSKTTPPLTTNGSTPITTNSTPHITTKTTVHTMTSPKSTMTIQTTPTVPIPIVPMYGLKDPNNRYYCILLQGEIEFEIPYTLESGKPSTFAVHLPRNASVTGSCSVNGTNNTQEIRLSFYDDWMFSVIIGLKSTDAADASVVEYSWKQIILSYVIDQHFFNPQKKDIGLNKTSTSSFDTFNSGSTGSFKCVSRQSLKVEDVTLDLSEFQYLGFGQTDSEIFPKTDATECDADATTTMKPTTKAPVHNNAGAIVGGVVGGIALLVIIVGTYMYCRKQQAKSQQYDTL